MAAKPMQMWEAELQLCVSRLSPVEHPTCTHKPSSPMATEDGEHRAGDPRRILCRSPCPLLHLLTPKGAKIPLQCRSSAFASPDTHPLLIGEQPTLKPPQDEPEKGEEY